MPATLLLNPGFSDLLTALDAAFLCRGTTFCSSQRAKTQFQTVSLSISLYEAAKIASLLFFYTFLCFHEILSKVKNIWPSNDRTFIRQSTRITELWKFSTIYYFSANHKTAMYFQLVYYFEIGRWSKNFRRTGIPADCCTKPTCFGLQIFIYPRLTFFENVS